MARRYQFTHQDLIRLGLNPQVVDDYVETRDSTILNVAEIERVSGEVVRIDGEVDAIEVDLQETNTILQQQVEALQDTNEQLATATGDITNLQDAVSQNNTAIQNNSTAITQTNDAVTVLQGYNRLGVATANTNPLPASANFDVEVIDSNGVILGYMPLFTSRW